MHHCTALYFFGLQPTKKAARKMHQKHATQLLPMKVSTGDRTQGCLHNQTLSPQLVPSLGFTATGSRLSTTPHHYHHTASSSSRLDPGRAVRGRLPSTCHMPFRTSDVLPFDCLVFPGHWVAEEALISM